MYHMICLFKFQWHLKVQESSNSHSLKNNLAQEYAGACTVRIVLQIFTRITRQQHKAMMSCTMFFPLVPLPPDVLFLLPPALHELFCFLAYFCSSESKKLSICAPVDCCLAWMGVLRLSSLPPESDGEREGVCNRRRKGVMKDGRVEGSWWRVHFLFNHPQGVERKSASLRDFFKRNKTMEIMPYSFHIPSLYNPLF